MSKIKIGITIGDVNGIGPEIIIKALEQPIVSEHFIPIIYGSSKVLAYHKNIVKESSFSFTTISSADKASYNRVNVINCWNENVNINLGTVAEEGGKFAQLSLQKATEDLKNGHIDAMVTAPINKQAMKMAGFAHTGHTEYITEEVGGKSLMMLCSDVMKVALVSNHVPVSEVAQTVTRETLSYKLKLFHLSLQKDFGIEKPTIAVLGLNPHAGEEGTIGNEEMDIIRPTIIEFKKSGMFVMGPFSADGFFGSGQFRKVDGILAMYHDQGLIPFKALSFGSGINFTAGLRVVRTSPDHGTAYDIAGNNEASPSSFIQAMYLAKEIVLNRRQYEEDRSNILEKKPKPSEDLS